MNRRSFLGTAVAVTVPSVAGCFSVTSITGGTFEGSVESISMRHEKGMHVFQAIPSEDPDREPVAFEELPEAAQREVAIMVAQGEYMHNDRDQIAAAGIDESYVTYQDQTFEILGFLNELVYRRYPQFESDWFVPVDLETTFEGSRLMLSLENVSNDRLQVGRRDFEPIYPPYFGPLIAWADDAYLLAHDAYERNDRIVTDEDLLYYYKWRRGPGDTVTPRAPTLGPGEALEETYRVPADLPDEASIWLLSNYRGPGVEDADSERGFGISWTITAAR